MFDKRVVRGNTYAASVISKNNAKKDMKPSFKKPTLKSMVDPIISNEVLRIGASVTAIRKCLNSTPTSQSPQYRRLDWRVRRDVGR